MSNNNNKEVWVGTILGTLLGTACTALLSNKDILDKVKEQSHDWFEKAKDIGDSAYNEFKSWKISPEEEEHHSHFTLGAIAGFLLGASSSLFLSPKTGKQFRDEVKKKYQDLNGKTQEIMDFLKEEKKPVKKSVKKAGTSVKRSLTPKVAKKRSPIKKTATERKHARV